MRRLTLILVLLLAAPWAAAAPVRAAAIHSTARLSANAKRIDTLLKGLLARGQFQGSVLVAQNGKTVLNKGYGGADWSTGLKNFPSTQFDIGSITKQFTALAILQLQEQGKLSVQDHICTYVPTCPAAWQTITLHMLLTHTSGIPDYPTRGTDYSAPPTVDQLITAIERPPLDFTPGARWSYSNAGYDLLGYVVQKVSGQSWSAYLQQHIFTPAGMTHTGVLTTGSAPSNLATGYSAFLGTAPQPPVPIDPAFFYAAGTMYSTTGDLLKWDRVLDTTTLASKATIAALFHPYVPISGDVSYGYGWIVGTLDGLTFEEHDGLVPGFASINIRLPSAGLTVILLCNLQSTDTTDVGLGIALMALGKDAGIQPLRLRQMERFNVVTR